MSLSLVKLSDNGFYCFFSKFGFFGLFSLWGGAREFVLMHQPGETRKTAFSNGQPFFMSCHPEGFLVLYLRAGVCFPSA